MEWIPLNEKDVKSFWVGMGLLALEPRPPGVTRPRSLVTKEFFRFIFSRTYRAKRYERSNGEDLWADAVDDKWQVAL